MNEKVINLLSLCLAAKERGINIWFSYSPHCNNVRVFAFKEGWESVPPDEEAERYFTHDIYTDWYEAEEQIAAAEQSIKNLIEEGSK